MKKETSKPLVREAVGIFFDSESLHEAVDELLAAGFSHEKYGLLDARVYPAPAVRRQLRHP